MRVLIAILRGVGWMVLIYSVALLFYGWALFMFEKSPVAYFSLPFALGAAYVAWCLYSDR